MSGQKFGVAGGIALVIGHFSGMLDLIALPVWVGALVERFTFSPQQAGTLVTLFLFGAVVASAIVAPRFNSMNQRLAASLGFAGATTTFLIAATQTTFAPLAILHFAGGVSVGVALSMVHGTIGLSINPHRLFAMAGIALGVMAVVLLAIIPQLLIAFGGPALFHVFAAIMGVATISTVLLFRNPHMPLKHEKIPFSRATWLTILGISIMTFNQAMVFSFVEVIGKSRGFAPENVLAVLIVLGFVNALLPSQLAAFLQTKIPAARVTQIGPAVQVVLAIIVTSATDFAVWAPAASIFVSIQIFTHTFAFGRLAQLDPTGRSVAATPAMLMVGAAFGPIVGGALGQNFGYSALGAAAVLIGLLSIGLFTKAKNA